MATGYRQSNEVVRYRNGAEEPYYARYSYGFEGLGTTANPLTAGQIVSVARSADGDALPAPDATELGLPQTRVTVRRYDSRTGEARIVVEWGERYISSFSLPTVRSSQSSVAGSTIEQPYGLITSYPTSSVFETQVRTVPRGVTRTTFRNLITLSDGIEDAIDIQLELNIGKLFTFNSIPRVLLGGSVRPFSATQGYVYTTFERKGQVRAIGEGELFNQGQTVNTPIAALGFNDEYGVPTGQGTPVIPATTIYEEGSVGSLPWLT